MSFSAEICQACGTLLLCGHFSKIQISCSLIHHISWLQTVFVHRTSFKSLIIFCCFEPHLFSLCQRGTLFSVLNIHNFYVPVQCIQLQEIFVSIICTFWTVHFVSKQRENTNRHVISLLIIFHTHNIVRNSGTFSIAYLIRPVPSFW